MDTNQKKVAVYVRVSTQEQAVEGVSIDAQGAALKANAKIQGWEIVDEYIDGGYSGGTDDRPALKRLLADAKQKRFPISLSAHILPPWAWTRFLATESPRPVPP